jgi:hypothetical protein
MERYCLTGQSSQRAVAPMEEEEEEEEIFLVSIKQIIMKLDIIPWILLNCVYIELPWATHYIHNLIIPEELYLILLLSVLCL